eukprot:3159298-Lingulodinium_polyedra.AAC.1
MPPKKRRSFAQRTVDVVESLGAKEAKNRITVLHDRACKLLGICSEEKLLAIHNRLATPVEAEEPELFPRGICRLGGGAPKGDYPEAHATSIGPGSPGGVWSVLMFQQTGFARH